VTDTFLTGYAHRSVVSIIRRMLWKSEWNLFSLFPRLILSA